jgi:hypothetical protein
MSYFATAEHEKERLQYFASPEGREDLYKYNQKESRTVLEVSLVTEDFHCDALAMQKLACENFMAIDHFL